MYKFGLMIVIFIVIMNIKKKIGRVKYVILFNNLIFRGLEVIYIL